MHETQSINSLIGFLCVQGQWQSDERGVVVAQVAPEHYLVQSLETAAHHAAKVVSVSDMKSWHFFRSHDDLDAGRQPNRSPTSAPRMTTNNSDDYY
jgi:hypothetical protein